MPSLYSIFSSLSNTTDVLSNISRLSYSFSINSNFLQSIIFVNKYGNLSEFDLMKLQRFMIMRFITIRVKDDDDGYLFYVKILKNLENVKSY